MTQEDHLQQLAAKRKGVPVSHGAYVFGRETSTHAIWRGMLARCGNTKSKDYHRYGAIGVKVCDRWKLFENFLADMGERPKNLQLDRFPDVNGDYEPINCRWASLSEQQLNKRSTKKYLCGGEELTPSQIALKLDMSRALVSYHIKRGRYVYTGV